MKYFPLIILTILTISSLAQHTHYHQNDSDPFETGIKDPEIRNITVINPQYDSIYYWSYSGGRAGWEISGKDDDFIYAGENLISKTSYQFDGTWVPVLMEVFTYDGQDNLLSRLIKLYNSGSWENAELKTFTFDENNNNTILINQFWSEGSWQNLNQRINTYDEAGNMLTSLYQTSDSTNAWYNDSHSVRTYNNHNLILTNVGQSWQDNVWENWYDYSYTYDDSARVSMILRKSWYQDDWNIQSKDHYHYTNNNMDTIWSEELVSGGWQNDRIISKLYDENDMEIYSLTRLFTNNEWTNNIQDSLGYDDRGNADYSYEEIWNSPDWEPFYRYCCKFNENNILTEYSFFSYQYDEMWGDSAHYFLRAGMGTPIIQTAQIRVYPNPTAGMITISGIDHLTTIELYSISGQRIAILPAENGTIDLSGLHNGIYLLRIIIGDKVVMKKIVKR
ncbi:MAG: T9SS type A sorting domain-containing protein [Bacteroidota bacterium]